MTSTIFKKILEKIPGYRKRFTRMSMDIAAQIYDYMKSEKLNQKQLAERLNKKESEISKWLNGNHNFTIETIAKIEEIFGRNIIYVPMYASDDLIIQSESTESVTQEKNEKYLFLISPNKYFQITTRPETTRKTYTVN